MDSLSKTQASLISAQGTPTYKAGMDMTKFNDLAALSFGAEMDYSDPNNPRWKMPDENQADYQKLMTKFTSAVGSLNFKPTITLNIRGKKVEIDIARDLMDGAVNTGFLTFNTLSLDENPELANNYKTKLLYYIKDLLVGNNKETKKETEEELQMSLDPKFKDLDAEEKESSFTEDWS